MRLSFVLRVLATSAIFSLPVSSLSGDRASSDSPAPLPTKDQIRWAGAEIGVIIHLDINMYAPGTFDYARRETLPPLRAFHPSKLNTDQWITSARNAGAAYAVLVAKHGTGFCLWPTRSHDYSVANTPWRNGSGDIVREFIASCRKFGLRPGIYYNTNLNTYLGAGPNGFTTAGERSAYNRTVINQLTELWTGYGGLSEIWFDGGVIADSCGGIADEVRALIAEHQPDAVLFQGPPRCGNLIRWVGNEDGRAPYPHWSRADVSAAANGTFAIADTHGNPDGNTWCPAEADFPGRRQSAWNGGWLWRANEDSLVFSPSELYDRYYTSVGRNANMLIGMVIDTSGAVPAADSAALSGLGERIRSAFAHPLARRAASGPGAVLTLGRVPVGVNTAVLRERIAGGERIRAFEIQAFLGGAWVGVCSGTSVGHKFIGRFGEVKTTSLRLRVTESAGDPALEEFSAYKTH
jgi:alpha-L-fucosidase